ncbi:MAG: hypothetical protein IKN64_03310 [Desulfovibrio sp.]|nr:hypothetical protein [Desulfovibrio sp.]
MHISSIDNAYLTELYLPESEGHSGSAPVAPQDIVNLSSLPEMTDEEVEGLMQETIQMIGNDSVSALSVHSGLDTNRVFALLGMA